MRGGPALDACESDLVDRDYVGMPEARHHASFGLQASPRGDRELLHRLTAHTRATRKELQRDGALQLDVVSRIDHAHAARPELSLDDVATDPGSRREKSRTARRRSR